MSHMSGLGKCWMQDDMDTWELPGFGKVIRRRVMRAEGFVERYIAFSEDGTQLGAGWRWLQDARANVEAHVREQTLKDMGGRHSPAPGGHPGVSLDKDCGACAV